jgi:hypothetical protein
LRSLNNWFGEGKGSVNKRPKALAILVVVALLGAGVGLWLWKHATAQSQATIANRLDDFVRVALDRKRNTDEREAAIYALRDAKDANRLLSLLPPVGDRDGITATVIEALGAVGDPKVLPALRQVEQNPPESLVSGEFWALLRIVIMRLEGVDAEQFAAQERPRE